MHEAYAIAIFLFVLFLLLGTGVWVGLALSWCIVMSIAILSLSLVGGDQAVRQEAQRVLSLVEIAQDESMLQGREFGLEIMEGSYRFLELNPLTGQWDEILGDDTLRLRELPEEIELFLYIEDREVLLKRDPAQLGDEEDDRCCAFQFVCPIAERLRIPRHFAG